LVWRNELRVVGPMVARKVQEMTADEEVRRLAELLRVRNAADLNIARLIGRPVERGHVGEWIAARLFDLDVAASATQAGWDGVFRSGPLAGRTVNVKFYGRREGGLDLRDADGATDEYMVLVGPPARDTRGPRPLKVSAVYLLEARPLLADLRTRGLGINEFSSVRKAVWEAAELYPRPNNPRLDLDERQRELLALLAAD
jgi:hypothetical protein